MSINFNKREPGSNSEGDRLETRARIPEMLLPQVLEKVVTPTIQLVSGINLEFLRTAADFPVIERSLKLLLICHPYDSRQDAAAVMLLQEPTALAQAVIEAAIPWGMKSEALHTSSNLLIDGLGRKRAADILVGLCYSNENITDLLINTVRGTPEAHAQGKQFGADPTLSVPNRPAYRDPLEFDDAGFSKVFLTTSYSTHWSSSMSEALPISSSRASSDKELPPLDQLALKAFLQLVPFASQTLPPEKFDRRYLDTVWETFGDNLAMTAFSGTFAAFQTNSQTRDLVFKQLNDLDSALAASLEPVVSRGLETSPVHLSPKGYYDWYNSQF